MLQLLKRKPKLDPSAYDTLISKDTEIGPCTLKFSGSIMVEGTITGEVIEVPRRNNCDSTVIVATTGKIQAPLITADFVLVYGEIIGNVHAKIKVIVKNGGKIIGDVSYGQIQIDHEGTVEGQLKKLTTVESPILPPVFGISPISQV